MLVCTDLHGNLADFRRMKLCFEERCARGRCQLLFTGDLIHGPNYTRAHWPDYLGSFYEDASAQLVDEFIELQARYPGQVHCLLGNHEHSHVGGPHTPKFWLDETLYFEESVGRGRAQRYCELFRAFPLAAVTPCGVAVTHAAPDVELQSLSELEQIGYEGYEQMSVESMQATPLLGRLIWSRSCSPAVARAFLRQLGACGWSQHVVVFGHDIVPEGYERQGDEQLQLSTSFGLYDSRKHFLELELEGRYRSALQLRVGTEIRPLYG